jgi:hypothetical protein
MVFGFNPFMGHAVKPIASIVKENAKAAHANAKMTAPQEIWGIEWRRRGWMELKSSTMELRAVLRFNF